MNSINWKAIGTWFIGFFGPGIGVLVPDMADGKPPTIPHLWMALAMALIGTRLVTMKRPADHK